MNLIFISRKILIKKLLNTNGVPNFRPDLSFFFIKCKKWSKIRNTLYNLLINKLRK